ncbi:hypothetical protein PHMEG_00030528 [Phytophthora megakarya]|uniref:Retrotransposon gag domain-containing protein n=1 Tax=Phytophthora megakarya TaxID=4795 RepID=A0A225UYJ9_9STRA|nr:hypothetical protein PHMEG_00030528 [Phytophthora megakarya]
MVMGMEAHPYPSSTALADWTASETGTELQRWKRKLKTAFGSKDVGIGRQPVARSAGETIAQHRPLGKITPFRGRLDESENSMQWLRGFVYEMKGTHTPPNEWCTAFQQSLRGGAVHWHRALSRKTKRTWSLLSDKLISYYCSQFSQSASNRYYRARRSEKEHIRDYLNRLNGYARSANIKFERSGREAKDHVKHFLEFETSSDNSLLCSYVTFTRSRISSSTSRWWRSEFRIARRAKARPDVMISGTPVEVGVMDATTVAVVVTRGVAVNHATLHASVTDLITELPTRASSERPDVYSNDYSNDDPIDFYEGDEADQDECDSDCGSRDEMQAANDNERRNAANGTFARSDKCPKNNGQQSSGFGQGGFRPATQYGSRFNDNRGGRGFQSSSYGPCAASGGQNHSTHFCFRRCRLCQQVHDFSKGEAFDELAKILRTNVDKKNISPELQKLVFGCPPTETGLVPTGQPQSADLVIDAEYLYAFIGKKHYNNNDENEKDMRFDGECGVCLDGGTLHEITKDTPTKKVVAANEAAPVHAKTVKLLQGSEWDGGRRRDSTDE